jgi:hypothetical protein
MHTRRYIEPTSTQFLCRFFKFSFWMARIVWEVWGSQSRNSVKLDHPRQLALMHALCALLIWQPLTALPPNCTLPLPRPWDIPSFCLALRSVKARAKGLVDKIPSSRRYRLRPQGYSICVLFLKLFERIYAPLAAGLLQPFRADPILQDTKRSQLDRLYARVAASLDKLLQAVGLKAA